MTKVTSSFGQWTQTSPRYVPTPHTEEDTAIAMAEMREFLALPLDGQVASIKLDEGILDQLRRRDANSARRRAMERKTSAKKATALYLWGAKDYYGKGGPL